MDYVSLSKGIFSYGKYKFGHERRNTKWISYKNKPWYMVFKEMYLAVEKVITEVDLKTIKQFFFDLKNFIDDVVSLAPLKEEISTAILLTSVNLPDHNLLLNKLKLELQLERFHIAIVWSRNAGTLKNFVDEVIYQIITLSKQGIYFNKNSEVKKNQYNFHRLYSWYIEENKIDTAIIIIIADFESFSSKVLHDFILILSSYSKMMKFVLIFGIATSLHIVHRLLPYNIASKLNMRVFHNQNQMQSLSDILNALILSPAIPFKITGKAFKLLIDIFLCCDFSVNGFRQNYKICIWKHFYGQNEKIVCSSQELSIGVTRLTENDLKKFKNLKSLKEYLQESAKKTKMHNTELKALILRSVKDFHEYISHFSIILNCLYNLNLKLPDFPLGKNFREIYAKAVHNTNLHETVEYKRVIQLISFLSKEDLLESLASMLSILSNYNSALKDIIKILKQHEHRIKDASLDVRKADLLFETNFIMKNRTQWRKVLKEKSIQSHLSPYNKERIDFVKYLDEEVFTKYLKSPYYLPINEIFCFNDAFIIKDHIRGPTKAAIHISLSDPNYFFECNCCKCLESEILQSHPDISIMYKLHLESKKIINIYDWMQSFTAVRAPEINYEEKDIDPSLHARFIQGMAELQFLGIIKATSKKADHVKKLI